MFDVIKLPENYLVQIEEYEPVIQKYLVTVFRKKYNVGKNWVSNEKELIEVCHSIEKSWHEEIYFTCHYCKKNRMVARLDKPKGYVWSCKDCSIKKSYEQKRADWIDQKTSEVISKYKNPAGIKLPSKKPQEQQVFF